MLTDIAIETFLEILAAVPEATLAFVAAAQLDDFLVQRVLAAASVKGCADRVELIDPVEFMRSRSEIMRDADLLLDSFPYGNLEMLRECLWIGCPVLTLDGAGPRSGASANLLRGAGAVGLITDSFEGYKSNAIRLLLDVTALGAVAAQLSESFKAMTRAKYEVACGEIVEKIESLWAAFYDRNR
jgi:predicted O-linked N-acetylglucosamine transferase (SPINDLY family)